MGTDANRPEPLENSDALGQSWPPACDDCGTTAGPLQGNTTTFEPDGTVRDGHLCGPCAAAATAPEPGHQTEENHLPVAEENPARRPVRMCVHCTVITDAPVVVSEVHGNSGPGFNVYACQACAPHFPKLPDAFDLLETGWRHRGTEGTR